MIQTDLKPTTNELLPPAWGYSEAGLVAVDADWNILALNQAAAELAGVGVGDAGGVGGAFVARLEGAEGALRQLGRGLGSAAAGGALRGVAVRREDRRVFVDVLVRSVASGAVAALGLPAGTARVVTLVDSTLRVLGEGELARVRAKLSESERARQKLTSLAEELSEQDARFEMVGRSAALQRVRDQVARVAASDTTALVQGETGSGKELVARSIHTLSARRSQAFVPVNCAALPESLIESELFGHERGAFTGADRRRLGKFELSDGGTLFLDEIAELPMQAQAKLLRVLQDGTFQRVGGAETVTVNVRVVAATHRDLARQVERGRFREDLYYRLNVFRIDVPPLRERHEDLRDLAEHLHARVARRMARPVLPLSQRSLRRVMAYAWPGNVRELANAVERATLLADGPELEIELPESPFRDGGPDGAGSGGGGGGQTTDVLLDLTLEQLERLHITHALERSAYRVFGESGAAARLDINPRTLLSRMDKFGIPRPRLMRRGRTEAES